MASLGLSAKPTSFLDTRHVTPASPAQPAPAAQPAAAAAVPAVGSFSFDLPSSPAVAAPAAAAVSPAGAAFTSTPVQLTFAPSLPQRSTAAAAADAPSAKSVKIDFSEFEEDIADMDRARRLEFEDHLRANAQRIATETRGTAPLPSQIGDSALFHSVVLKQYGKVHHLDEIDPKKAFASRKAKARDARKAKKAEDRADQMEARTGGVIRKTKQKHRAKGVY